MKKIVLMITTSALAGFLVSTNAMQTHPAKQKKDTVRRIKNQPKPRVVKNRAERMRMQQQQIKYHDKQLKKVHDAQKELNKELHKKDSD